MEQMMSPITMTNDLTDNHKQSSYWNPLLTAATNTMKLFYSSTHKISQNLYNIAISQYNKVIKFETSRSTQNEVQTYPWKKVTRVWQSFKFCNSSRTCSCLALRKHGANTYFTKLLFSCHTTKKDQPVKLVTVYHKK